MIPAPIPADFERSAEKDYYPYTLSGLEWGSGACWIRLVEYYRLERDRLAAENAELRRRINLCSGSCRLPGD